MALAISVSKTVGRGSGLGQPHLVMALVLANLLHDTLFHQHFFGISE